MIRSQRTGSRDMISMVLHLSVCSGNHCVKDQSLNHVNWSLGNIRRISHYIGHS